MAFARGSMSLEGALRLQTCISQRALPLREVPDESS